LSDGQQLALGGSEKAIGSATLALRQEDLAVAPEGGDGLRAKVKARVFLGARIRYVLDLAGTEIRVLAGNDRMFASGDAVTLTIEPSRIRVLTAADEAH
jgi:ABC-type Fe3+/spermidine/putrescine transport system ATPase subunit